MTEQQDERNAAIEIQARIGFGMDVETFIRSDIGKYLIGKAEREIGEALEFLKTVDPTDAKAVQALQNQVKVAESIQFWLAEAIDAGLQAEQQYQEANA